MVLNDNYKIHYKEKNWVPPLLPGLLLESGVFLFLRSFFSAVPELAKCSPRPRDGVIFKPLTTGEKRLIEVFLVPFSSGILHGHVRSLSSSLGLAYSYSHWSFHWLLPEFTSVVLLVRRTLTRPRFYATAPHLICDSVRISARQFLFQNAR
jgi:hypothetical protein